MDLVGFFFEKDWPYHPLCVFFYKQTLTVSLVHKHLFFLLLPLALTAYCRKAILSAASGASPSQTDREIVEKK